MTMFLEAVFRNLIDFFENFWSGNFNKSGVQFFLGGAESGAKKARGVTSGRNLKEPEHLPKTI